MEDIKEKIEIYKERSFGKRLSATLAFLHVNARPILHYSLLFLLPIVLIYNFFFCVSTGQVFKSLEVSYLTPTSFWVMVGWLLFGLLLVLGAYSFFFTLIRLYQDREDGLKSITFDVILKQVKKFFVKMAVVLFWGIVIAFCFLACWHWWGTAATVVIAVLFFFAVLVPLSIILPVYCMEDKSLWKTLGRSFRLGYQHYGSIFSMGLLLTFDMVVLSLFFAFPYLIFLSIESTFFNSSDTFDIPLIYQIFDYIFSLLMVAGIVLSSLVVHVGMTYQYGHASTHKNHQLVVDDVDKTIESFKVLRED